MNDPSSDQNDFVVAEVADSGWQDKTQPPVRPKPVKPWKIALIIAVSLAAFIGLAVLQFVAENSLPTRPSRHRLPLPASVLNQETWQADVAAQIREDLFLAKTEMHPQKNVESHPDYEKFLEFVGRVEQACDETPNAQLKPLINFQRYADAVTNSLMLMEYSRWEIADLSDDFRKSSTGPTSFSQPQILAIKKLNATDYKLYLSISTGYSEMEPVVWWIEMQGDRLQLYDWADLDLGLRSSTENAVLIDAEVQGVYQYDKYADLSYDYLDYSGSYDEESSRKTREILTSMEDLELPPMLATYIKVVLAKRWHLYGDQDAALRVLNQMQRKDLAPGCYALLGDIYQEQNKYDEAAIAYRSYQKLLGNTPRVVGGLCTCYRELGDVPRELKLLSDGIPKFPLDQVEYMVRALRLADDTQQKLLLQKVDERSDAHEVYHELLEALGYSPYAYHLDELRVVAKHVQIRKPESVNAMMAKFYLARFESNLELADDFLARIPQDDEGDYLRYTIWQILALLNRAVPEFEKSARNPADFASILDAYENDVVSPQDFLAICELMLQQHPESHLALLERGYVLNLLQQYDQAQKSFSKAITILESADAPDHIAEALHYGNLDALYMNGDDQKAREFAGKHDLLHELVSLKSRANDFSGIPALLDAIGDDDEKTKIERAKHLYRTGEKEKALVALAKLIKESPECHGIYGYMTTLRNWCSESGNPERAFELNRTPQQFAGLFRQYLAHQDWERCQALVDNATDAVPELELLEAQMKLDWEQENYAQICAIVKRKRSQDPIEWRRDILDYCVRSAIRIRDWDLATWLANMKFENFGNSDSLALVALKRQDVQASERHLNQLVAYDLYTLQTDADVGDEFLDFAATHKGAAWSPLRLMPSTYTQSIGNDLLLKDRLKLSSDTISDRFSDVLPTDWRVQKLENQRPGIEAWYVTSPKHRVWITQTTTPSATNPAPKHAQDMLAESSHKFSISVAQNTDRRTDGTHELCHNFLAKFVDSRTVAMGQYGRWISAQDATTDSGDLKPYSRLSVSMSKGFYYEPTLERTPGRATAVAQWRLQLAQVARRFDDREDDDTSDLTVYCEINVNGASEQIPFQVERILPNAYGMEFIGKVVAPSKFAPRLRTDIEFSLSHPHVVRADFTTDGKTKTIQSP